MNNTTVLLFIASMLISFCAFMANLVILIVVQWTIMRSDIKTGKKDINNIGDKARQLELKGLYSALLPADDRATRQELLNAWMRRMT